MSTVHNSANVGDIAKDCLMAGDPLRAKFIAENYLEDAKLVNSVRNMFCYTGTYKGKPISVMGSGMGMASIAIYCHELFAFYGVENIIRVGSCGGMKKGIKLYDIIIGEKALTTSNIGFYLGVGLRRKLSCSKNLLEKAKKVIGEQENCYFGKIYSSDIFYTKNNVAGNIMTKRGCLGVEMESFALYAEAKRCKKNAITLLTVSDVIGTKEETTPEEREKSFTRMMELALKILTDE